MRRPRWDRTTAACRPSRWRFLILDKTMERPVARFRALLFTRPFRSSSFSRRLPFRSLQQMCTTASRSPSLFFCRAGRTRVTASPCAQRWHRQAKNSNEIAFSTALPRSLPKASKADLRIFIAAPFSHRAAVFLFRVAYLPRFAAQVIDLNSSPDVSRSRLLG